MSGPNHCACSLWNLGRKSTFGLCRQLSASLLKEKNREGENLKACRICECTRVRSQKWVRLRWVDVQCSCVDRPTVVRGPKSNSFRRYWRHVQCCRRGCRHRAGTCRQHPRCSSCRNCRLRARNHRCTLNRRRQKFLQTFSFFYWALWNY